MALHTETFELRTKGKGTYEITDEVEKIVTRSKIAAGTVTVFVRHTSCSLVIMENAAPAARRDLENFSSGLSRRMLITSTTTKDQTTARRIFEWHSRGPAKPFRLQKPNYSSGPGREFFFSNIGAPRITARSSSR